ncbi:MAG: bidirectional [NiFe] hydrogenase diaphorase subunit, partial [Thermoproteota archaeon]|nr:bidirectional [NiFe] hydrogenase diaphorase subunit [Thermoproteota archaeon]
MSKKVTLEIDGKTVEAEEEATVLKAAEDAGIKIPTLCYDKQMEPYGACRLCIVEVTRNNRKRTVVSCTYPVEEGIKVETNSDKIRKLRKTLIEEMIPLSPTSGPLNSLAEEYGADKKRFKGEASDCVLCGLCVRYCASVNKTPAVTFVGRGT